jgi:hypothetical protein
MRRTVALKIALVFTTGRSTISAPENQSLAPRNVAAAESKRRSWVKRSDIGARPILGDAAFGVSSG